MLAISRLVSTELSAYVLIMYLWARLYTIVYWISRQAMHINTLVLAQPLSDRQQGTLFITL